MKSPCMDCKDRKLNCHSTCNKYKEYKNNIKKHKTNNVDYDMYLSEAYDRMRERRGVMRI